MAISKTTQDRLAYDDEEIARLERKLGIKKKSKKSKDEDGLDDLLGDLGDSDSGGESLRKRKSHDTDWLQQKRRKVEVPDESDFEGFSGSNAPSDSDQASGSADEQSDQDEPVLERPAQSSVESRTRENPYVPPTAGKYVPPSLRKAPASDDEVLLRLRRRVQGLINRLSESNLLSILQSVEALYADNARQHVTLAVIDTLLALVADVATLTDTFIVLHAGFVAALYRAIGVDFGAQFLEKTVTSLDAQPTGKRAANLVSLLSAMYNFDVISCHIIYDLVRQYVAAFSEEDTELLLRIIRTCGTQLRQDDPSALKDVITTVQKKASELGEKNTSVRQRFMVDTMNDLKNNRVRAGMASSASRSESMTSMKKLLGTVKSRSTKASEPFRLSLQDIRESDKKGKWWLVGASYHDPAKMVDNAVERKSIGDRKSTRQADPEGDDLATIGRALGMNTDIRRAIFTAIMSSADYKEAVIRIKKLTLKRSQIEEIAKVLVQCVVGEATYNAYYAVLAREFCHERSVKWAFQTLLWDNIKRMDLSADDDDSGPEDEADRLEPKTIVCLAKLYAALIRKGALSITMLKTLDWAYVQPRTHMFLEILLTSIILDKSKADAPTSAEAILCQVQDVPDMVMGFSYFLGSAVAKSEIPDKARHKKKVAQVCSNVVARLANIAPES